MNTCLWCDDPCGEEKLCPSCRAVNDHSLFHCKVSPPRKIDGITFGHLPTLGDSCAECDYIAEAKARRAAIDAPHLESLRRIRAQHVADWHRPWPGMEFGKATFGMMLDSAIKELES